LQGSTGRFEVSKIENEAGESYLAGVVDSEGLKALLNNWLKEEKTIPRGRKIIFSLRDLSGAANDVYIGFYGRRAS